MSTKRNPRKKFLLVGVLLLALLLAGFGVLLFIQNQGESSRIKKQTAYNNGKKEAVVNNGGVPVGDSSPGKGSPLNGAYQAPTDNSGITINPRTSGSDVIVLTKLIGYSDGTCSLTITNTGHTTTQSADVIFAPDYSSCAGFSVPIKALGNGQWNITLTVSSGGHTNTKVVTYGVSS